MASCGKLYTSCIVSAPALCGHLVDSTPVKSWREPFKHCVQRVDITESLVGHLLQSHRGGVHVHQQPRAMWLDKEAVRGAGHHVDDQWGQADADGASGPVYQVRVGSHQYKSNPKAKSKPDMQRMTQSKDFLEAFWFCNNQGEWQINLSQ